MENLKSSDCDKFGKNPTLMSDVQCGGCDRIADCANERRDSMINVKIDKELEEFIENLIDDKELNWVERMDCILSFKRMKRNMVGIHLFGDFNENDTNESVARMYVMMALNEAKGKFKDTTSEVF